MFRSKTMGDILSTLLSTITGLLSSLLGGL
jgi:hypothetical protein